MAADSRLHRRLARPGLDCRRRREDRPHLAGLGARLLLAAVVLLAGWIEQGATERFLILLAGAASLFGVVLVGSAGLLGLISPLGAALPAVSRPRRTVVVDRAGAGVLALALAAVAPQHPVQMLPLGCAAAIAFLLAGITARPVCTWVGSALVLLTLAQALTSGVASGWVAHPLLVALLLHATLVLLLSLVLRSGRLSTISDSLHALFIDPLSRSATVSSLLTIPALA